MKAIVCDCCGKVTLLKDYVITYSKENTVYRLVNDNTDEKLDLCEECADKLMAAVRKE